jgi:protein SCO1/2
MTDPPPPAGSHPGADRFAIGLALAMVGVVAIFALLIWRALPAAAPDLGDGAKVMPEPRPIPEFQLSDADGRAFDRSRLLGHWSLLFFGYTYCPDVCPFVMQNLASVAPLLEERFDVAHLPQVVFVSVDPQRDDPERLAEYVGFFDESFIGVSGSDEQLEVLTRAVGAFYQRHDDETLAKDPESYLVDHASKLFLVDPMARYLALLEDPHAPEEFVDLLARVQAIGEGQ